jgi:hypothetical protein
MRDRAVRMVVEHASEQDSQWAAIRSIAERIGCSAETLRKWARQGEWDAGKRGVDLLVHLGSLIVLPIPSAPTLTVPLPLPIAPSLAGLVLHAESLHAEPGGNLATSAGLTFGYVTP